MTELRYPLRALAGDYLRAGLGLVASIGPALALPTDSPILYVLVPMALLFAVFALRTWRNQITRAAVDREGISLFSPARVSFAWRQVRSVRLNYYSTRRDRTGGWMQLTIKAADGGAERTIRLDSRLERFDEVARLAAAAARAANLELNEATAQNFAALGVDVSSPTAQEAGQ